MRPQGTRQWILALIRITIIFLVLMSSLFAFTTMPGSSFSDSLPPLTAEERQTTDLLQKHVYTLAQGIGSRTIWNPPSMDRTVSYLEKELTNLKNQLEKISKKLANADFLKNAPKDVIEKEKGKKKDIEERVEKLNANLEQLLGW